MHHFCHHIANLQESIYSVIFSYYQHLHLPMAVNVRAVVEACLLASKKMEPNGIIVTIGSNMAEHVPFLKVHYKP